MIISVILKARRNHLIPCTQLLHYPRNPNSSYEESLRHFARVNSLTDVLGGNYRSYVYIYF
jgi:hypothetical protein